MAGITPRYPKPRRPRFKGMTRPERLFSARLEAARSSQVPDPDLGRVLAWYFEGLNFRLGPGRFFRPDFWIATEEAFVAVDTKATRWVAKSARFEVLATEDAALKIIEAATLYPSIRWITAALEGRGGMSQWRITETAPDGGFLFGRTLEPEGRESDAS